MVTKDKKVNVKIILRITLSVLFGLVGVLFGRVVLHPDADFLIIVSLFAFGILGFILPEVLELAGQAGITALANQIMKALSDPSSINPIERFSFKTRKKKGVKYVNPLVLDTSALVDGRIVEVTRTGFIYGNFLVIPSVISELQILADSADELRRMRGRRGLEALEILEKQRVKVEILKSEPEGDSVDEKLVVVARRLRAKIVTVDFNLNKVAKVQGVAVLNVNELTNALKAPVLPGEHLTIVVNTIGRGRNQGVGYLADGTMVVVEGGAKLIGREVTVLVHRLLQTEAGKMIFARPSA